MLTNLFPNVDWEKMWEATYETLYMTAISTVVDIYSWTSHWNCIILNESDINYGQIKLSIS